MLKPTTASATDRSGGRVILEAAENKTGDFEAKGPDFDYVFGALQTGLDLIRLEGANGSRDQAGISVAFGSANSNADSLLIGEAGTLAFTAHAIGAYWTHFGSGGWYLDAVAQATRYSDMTATTHDGDTLTTGGWGFAASIEGGYPIALHDGWSVEPQAQLIYQALDLEDAADVVSLVRFGRTEGLKGRVGARIVKHWTFAEDRRDPVLITWFRANIWHEFLGKSETTISDLSGLNPLMVQSDIGGTIADFGIGFDGRLGDHASLFANADVVFGLDGRGGRAMARRWGSRRGGRRAPIAQQ